MRAVAWLLIGVLLGYAIGWTKAHRTVAAECERLGGFFVYGTVYKCIVVEDREKDAAE